MCHVAQACAAPCLCEVIIVEAGVLGSSGAGARPQAATPTLLGLVSACRHAGGGSSGCCGGVALEEPPEDFLILLGQHCLAPHLQQGQVGSAHVLPAPWLCCRLSVGWRQIALRSWPAGLTARACCCAARRSCCWSPASAGIASTMSPATLAIALAPAAAQPPLPVSGLGGGRKGGGGGGVTTKQPARRNTRMWGDARAVWSFRNAGRPSPRVNGGSRSLGGRAWPMSGGRCAKATGWLCGINEIRGFRAEPEGCLARRAAQLTPWRRPPARRRRRLAARTRSTGSLGPEFDSQVPDTSEVFSASSYLCASPPLPPPRGQRYMGGTRGESRKTRLPSSSLPCLAAQQSPSSSADSH